MSNTVKQLGFIPTNRGEYDTTGQTKYYKDNVVQYRNGSYICTPVGYSSSNPTAYTTDAPYQDGDTELNANWKLMASVGLIDEEPVAESDNLVKSGGIIDSEFKIIGIQGAFNRGKDFQINKETFGLENGYYYASHNELIYNTSTIHKGILLNVKDWGIKGLKLSNSLPNPAVANFGYFDGTNWTIGKLNPGGTGIDIPESTEKIFVNFYNISDYPDTTLTLYPILKDFFPPIEKILLSNDRLVNNNTIYPILGYSLPNNGYLDISGVFHATTAWRTSDYIPVVEGDIINFKCGTLANTVATISLYNKNKEFIQDGSVIPSETIILESSIVIPSNVCYIRFTTPYSVGTLVNYKLEDCYLLVDSKLSFKERFNELNNSIEDRLKNYIDTNLIAGNQIQPITLLPSSVTLTQVLTDEYYIQAGTSITKNSMNNLGSLELNNVEVGKVYYLKITQDVPVSLYKAYFIFAIDNTTAAIPQSKIVDYVKLIDSTNHVYQITIPEGCVKVFTAGYYSTFNEFWVKEKFSQYLEWLKINYDNLNQDLKDKIDSITTFDSEISSLGESQTKLNNTIHLFDSIKKPITFSGKRLAAFGDSITWGVCSPNLQSAGSNKYISLFCSYVGATEVNLAHSGACITPGMNEIESIYTTITSYQGTTDIIVIAGGVNDWQTQATIGNFSDTGTSTLYGALNGICSYLKTNYPDAIVIFITPIPTTSTTTFGTTHPDNLNLYRKAIQEVAAVNGFNVVNGADLGLPDEMTPYGNAIFDDSDRVHPTLIGHSLYARSLTGKLL